MVLGPLVYVLSRNENEGVGLVLPLNLLTFKAKDIVTSQFKLFIELVGGRSRNQSPTTCYMT